MLHKFHPENKFQVQVYCGRLNWMAIIYIYICYFFCSLLLYFHLANKVCSVIFKNIADLYETAVLFLQLQRLYEINMSDGG